MARGERGPAKEVALLRASAAAAYELAYEEARRALDGQERALAAFRTRAGVVWAFRVAVIALVVEVSIWLVELAAEV